MGWAGPVAGLTSSSPEYLESRAQAEAMTARMQAIEARQPLPPHGQVLSGRGVPAAEQRRLLRQLQRDPRRCWPEADRREYEELAAQRRRLSHDLVLRVQVRQRCNPAPTRPTAAVCCMLLLSGGCSGCCEVLQGAPW